MHRLVEEKIPGIAEICARHRVKRLEVFGSVVGDRFDPDSSDIDFLVEFEAMSPKEHARSYLGLAEDLEAFFERSVDLIEFPAIRNQFFRQSIEETRAVVYASA